MKEYIPIKEHKFRDWINLFIHGYRTLKNNYNENPYFFIFSFFHFFIRFIACLTVVSILLVLPATMNRASWVGVGVSSFFVINQRYGLINQFRGWLKSGIRKIIAISGILVIVISIISGLYQLKAGSSFGRLFIWEVTASKIAEKPLFGYGVGRFEAEYNNWQADYFKNHPEEMDGPKGMAAGNTKYCFNEYLEMVSELGFIGLFLFLAVVASAFIEIKNERIYDLKVETVKDNYHIILALISSLISLLVCALISLPFYSLTTLIVFFLLLAVISSQVTRIITFRRLLGTFFKFRFSEVAAFILLVPGSLLIFYQARQQYKAFFSWKESIMLYKTQYYEEACKSFPKYSRSLKYTGAYLQYYGKALNMNRDYQQSIKMLKRAINFTTDEVLYTTLGDSYKKLNKYLEAEETYQHASLIVPHKLYPRYKLAILYTETGQELKAVKAAQEVLSKKTKVVSTATEEIMHEMRNLINDLKKGNKELKFDESNFCKYD